MQSPQLPDKYRFKIKNICGVEMPCVLFGANKNHFNANFGNNTQIDIIPLNEKDEAADFYYSEALMQTISDPFKCKKITVTSTNIKQVCTSIQFKVRNPKSPTIPMPIVIDMENCVDAAHLQAAKDTGKFTISVPVNFIIDGTGSIHFLMQAKTELIIEFEGPDHATLFLD